MSGRFRLSLAALLALTAACSRERPAEAERGVIIAATSEPDVLLPPLVATTQGKQVVDMMFDYLADIGPALNTTGDAGFTPSLARRWAWASDSLSIAFELDPRARWHDGRPVRAEDVRFTVALIKDSTLASPIAANLGNVDSVTVRDSLTAVAWFHRRTPEQFFDLVYNVAVLPAHRLAGIRPAELRTSAFARQPVGSGPFRFARWVPATMLQLTADSAYFGRRPSLARVTWVVSENPTAASVRLARGEADFLESVRGEALARVRSTPSLHTVHYGSLDYGYLGFNQRDPARPSRAHALFADRAMRLALSHAIDRRALVTNVLDSAGAVGIGPLTRAVATADTTLPLPAYDAALAARALDSLGWRLAPGATVRARGGRPLEFELLVPTSSEVRRRMAVLVQDQLARVGARVTITELEANTFVERLAAHKFDAMLNTWRTDPSPASIRQSWAAASIAGGSNYVGYASPRFDALVDSASAAIDPAASRALYRRAYERIIDDAPAVWLYELRNTAAASGRLQVAGMRADAWWAQLPWWSAGGETLARR